MPLRAELRPLPEPPSEIVPALPAKPAYSLNDRVLASTPSGRTGYGARGPFRLSHTLAVGIDDVLSGRYALGLRTAPADGDHLIYCADLQAPAPRQ